MSIDYDRYDERVYVIDHGLHTGLVIETRFVLESLGLEDSVYRDYRFVEFGRGDAGFYQEEQPAFSTTLAALFVSTPAVIHIRGYNNPPDRRYPLSQTLEVRLSKPALEKLINAVVQSFALSDEGKAIEVGKGVDARSNFFQANGTYHMFYTCNNWTAEMVELADYPINHRWAFFAGSVMRQIEAVQRRLGLSCGTTTSYQCADSSEAANQR